MISMYQSLCSLEEQVTCFGVAVGIVIETTNRQDFCHVRRLLPSEAALLSQHMLCVTCLLQCRVSRVTKMF